MFTDIMNLLLGTVFYALILIAFLRFLFQLQGVDFYNPFSQFVVKATDPVLKPLRSFLPSKGRIDFASLLAILVLKLVELVFRDMLTLGSIVSFYKIFALSIMQLTDMALNFYLFAIFAQIVLSWLAPYNNNPVVIILHQITEPILKPARNLIPPIGGLDLSPILVILAIQVIELLLLHPNGLLPVFFTALGRALGLL